MPESAPTQLEAGQLDAAIEISKYRKYLLLILFCLSQFLDAFKYGLDVFQCSRG